MTLWNRVLASLPMEHGCSCGGSLHCLGTASSVVRPCLGHVGSGVSLYLRPYRLVCETLSMTLCTRVRVFA